MQAGRIVEAGATGTVFRSPQHPYTRQLAGRDADDPGRMEGCRRCLLTAHSGSIRRNASIAGRWLAGARGARLAVEDPSTGARSAAIARGGADEIDAAVAAAEAAPRRRLGPDDRDRARPHPWPHRAGGAGARRRSCACSRRSDVGKPLKQARADAAALARYMEFYGGRRRQGDGRDDPLSRRLHRLHPARTARRDRAHRALELSDADHRPLGRRGAGDGQCLRAETGRGGQPDRARLRRASPARPGCRPAR